MVLGCFSAGRILNSDSYEVSSSSLIYPVSQTCSRGEKIKKKENTCYESQSGKPWLRLIQ